MIVLVNAVMASRFSERTSAANRILTVGAAARARLISQFLDTEPMPVTISSSRGFETITGHFKGVPVSIVSIGMVS